MVPLIDLEILPQPDDITCGPTCLQAVYRHFGDDQTVEQLIVEVPKLESGGTLAVLLGIHALRRGYHCRLYTYDLRVFDPTWFHLRPQAIQEKLRAQLDFKTDPRVGKSIAAFDEFLAAGGELRFEDLTVALIRKYLKRRLPILAGLSATYLYRSARELGIPSRFDDLRGGPQGHFVVLCGYNGGARTVLVADPLLPNPMASTHYYEVGIERLQCAIMLGILTFDANLLIIKPRRRRNGDGGGDQQS